MELRIKDYSKLRVPVGGTWTDAKGRTFRAVKVTDNNTRVALTKDDTNTRCHQCCFYHLKDAPFADWREGSKFWNCKQLECSGYIREDRNFIYFEEVKPKQQYLF